MESLTNGEKERNADIHHSNLVNVLKSINVSAFVDKWGPKHVVHVYDTDTNIQGLLIIDNTILGPGCGGIQISKTITPHDVFVRARNRTWAFALFDLDLGGAAACIWGDPDIIDRETAIRSFAREVNPYVPDHYVIAPNWSIGTEEIAIFVDEVGDRQGATGKPQSYGGIPSEVGTVGLGLGITVEYALASLDGAHGLPQDPQGLRVAILGFDDVGIPAAKYLASRGARIVSVSDHGFTNRDPDGLEVESVARKLDKRGSRTVKSTREGTGAIAVDETLNVDCDVLILAGGRNPITEENYHLLSSKCIVEGPDASISSNLDRLLANRDILILPEILTCSGGLICSSAEYQMVGIERSLSLVESRIGEVTEKIIGSWMDSGVPIRRIARQIAQERVLEVMEAKK